MYLIFLNSQLLGYTYNKLAVIALIRVNNRFDNLPLKIKETPDNYPVSGVKTSYHIDNIVKWYENHGYDKYMWKYIVYNRGIIPEFSLRFIGEFHDTMCAIYDKYYEEYVANV